MASSAWVGPDNAVLLTDLYQLTMMQAYWREGMTDRAVFSLFVRRLPPSRNVLLACGLADVLAYLESVRFDPDSLDYLDSLGLFGHDFLDWLSAFRFTGDVYAVPEGTPIFANEPILEIEAPLPEAQFVETFVMNQIHLQTLLASKALRVVEAAEGRRVVDFGLRRMQGADAGLKSARAFYIAGVHATSNVLAGRLYGIPVTGTMAHSYVQAHRDERAAFRAFLAQYPDSVLLIDTYDTLGAVEEVIALARELGPAFRLRGVRIDSGDLDALARAVRRRLDEAGLTQLQILVSGSLDEAVIRELVRSGAPIDGFGVGTRMGVSADAPALDLVYKLAAYAGRGRIKTSPGKVTLPGRKQIFRQEEEGRAVRDVLALADETLPGRPLLRPVLRGGRRLPEADEPLDVLRARARDELARLPEAVRGLDPADPPYPVDLSPRLRAEWEALLETVS